MLTRNNQYLHTIKGCLAFAVVSVAVMGCAVTTTVEETQLSTELAPMQKPVRAEKQRVYEFDNLKDAEKYYEILEVRADGSLVGQNNEGCKWVGLGDLVSPSLSWEKCSDSTEWHSGENRDMQKKGEIWPLKVGNKVSYTYSNINALGQDKGRKTRKCNVTDTVNITVASGNADTYKVVCKRSDGSWSQTIVFYFSPEIESYIKYVRSSSSDGIQSDSEFIRVEQL